MNCRSCSSASLESVIDLGSQPLSNAFLTKEQLSKPEITYPLHAFVCTDCWLMQVDEYEAPEGIFGDDYAYFSSQSAHWLEHCERYTANIIDRFHPANVLELASNDGYLLKMFQARGKEVLGIEPARNVAAQAEADGVPTLAKFFGYDLAGTIEKYDLIVGNNVLAHVPDLNDFISGMQRALAPAGVITMEFPYLGNLLEDLQFDTIYHEHFSYFSLFSAHKAFQRHGLDIFDVELLPTHGGSLRIYACHTGLYEPTEKVSTLGLAEQTTSLAPYRQFNSQARRYKRVLLRRLIDRKDREFSKLYGDPADPQDVQIVAYGAPAKGNTMLNYCGIGTELIDYCVDTTPYKQGKYLPGSHIPVYHPDKLSETQPNLVYIQPWNWQEEILDKLQFVRDWGGEFLVRTSYR